MSGITVASSGSTAHPQPRKQTIPPDCTAQREGHPSPGVLPALTATQDLSFSFIPSLRLCRTAMCSSSVGNCTKRPARVASVPCHLGPEGQKNKDIPKSNPVRSSPGFPCSRWINPLPCSSYTGFQPPCLTNGHISSGRCVGIQQNDVRMAKGLEHNLSEV